MSKKIFLIPVAIDENQSAEMILTGPDLAIVRRLKCFIVEESKTARAQLKAFQIETAQKDIEVLVHNKKDRLPLKDYFEALDRYGEVGLMSEAGCPGIADPGAEIVAEAHRRSIDVFPMVGPSSILLSLMASGMNGQNFAFVGYIPIDKMERLKRLAELERSAEKFNQTQLFIETPFRNNHLFDDVVRTCKPTTRLCIAAGIGSKEPLIKTMSVAEWQQNKPELHKIPCIFILGK